MSSFARDTRGWRPGIARALVIGCALLLLFAASASAAAPNWLEPVDLSKPGRDASNPAVAADSAGNTIALWERQSTLDPSFNLQIASRAPGTAFSAPAEFLAKSTEPHLAITPGGEAVAVWKHFENPPGVYTIQVALRPPGGAFGPPITAYTAEPGVIPQEVQVAIGAGGTTVVSWSLVDPNSGLNKVVCSEDPITKVKTLCPNPSLVMASVRPPGGSFTPAVRVSAPRGVETPPGGEDPKVKLERERAEAVKTATGPRPAVDGAGNSTVVFSYFDGTDNVVESAVMPAGGSFAAPLQISESGEDAGAADVGIDAAGNVIATWVRNEGAARRVQAATKPPGGNFAALGDVSAAGATAERPVIGVTPGGTATIVWRTSGVTEDLLQSASRPPGGAFGPPASLSSGKDNPLFYELAVGDEGDAIVVWSGDNGASEVVRAAIRGPGGGAFDAPVAISQATTDLLHPFPAMDAGGNATVVWGRDNGSNGIVQAAGYDADPPQLRDIVIPAAGTVATALQFSAASSDAWSVGPPAFAFGDGATGQGASVSHAYSAPGTYTVTVTATDAVGRTASSTGTVLVKARNSFTIGKLVRNRKRGTATLTVTVPEPGTLTATGKGIAKANVRTSKGAALKLTLKATGKGRKTLGKVGKLKARLKIAYSQAGGDTSTQQRGVTLQKKLG